MKQVFVAKYRHGLKGPTKVAADDVESAKKAAFAAYAYTASMGYPGWRVDEVVESVELDPDQTLGGPGMQPVSQFEGTEGRL